MTPGTERLAGESSLTGDLALDRLARVPLVTSIDAVNGLPAVALDSFGLPARSVGAGDGGAVGVAAPPNAFAMAR